MSDARSHASPSRMHLLLVLPDLLALSDGQSPAGVLPALARLVAAAGRPAIEDGTMATTLARHYGVEQQADWPLAPIRLAALGVDPGDTFWLDADPVTLVVGRNDVRLGGIVDDLGPDDADALVEMLNRHFAGDGLRFTAPRPDAWFVRVEPRPRISTQPLAAAAGGSLRALPFAGPDAEQWQRWHSEIQMLLHEHPVNLVRERAGRPPANSLWFSGGGTLPARAGSELAIRTFANAGVAAALAAHAGSPARALPADLGAVLDEGAGATQLVVVLDSPLDPATLDSAWAAPAYAALVAGSLASAELLTESPGTVVAWRARRPGLWRRLAGPNERHDLAALLAAGRRNE